MLARYCHKFTVQCCMLRMKWFVGVFIIASVLAVQSRHNKHRQFQYSAQDKWPGACTSGQKQSPINVITKDVKCNKNLTALKLSDEYFTHISGTFANNGHSVVFTPHSSVNAVMTTPVGQYKLLSLHMHWGPAGHSTGSEHLVDNKASDIELHFVHVKLHAQDKDASDYHAVMSVRGRIQDMPSETFAKLDVTKVKTYHSKISVSDIHLSSLLPSNLDYYYYQGSLTTPSCDQNVQWFLLKKTIGVAAAYVGLLDTVCSRHGKPVGNNCRKTQPLNGRIVTQVKFILTKS